jgi:hypothetical protein
MKKEPIQATRKDVCGWGINIEIIQGIYRYRYLKFIF